MTATVLGSRTTFLSAAPDGSVRPEFRPHQRHANIVQVVSARSEARANLPAGTEVRLRSGAAGREVQALWRAQHFTLRNYSHDFLLRFRLRTSRPSCDGRGAAGGWLHCLRPQRQGRSTASAALAAAKSPRCFSQQDQRTKMDRGWRRIEWFERNSEVHSLSGPCEDRSGGRSSGSPRLGRVRALPERAILTPLRVVSPNPFGFRPSDDCPSRISPR